jgi:hypothetical protein
MVDEVLCINVNVDREQVQVEGKMFPYQNMYSIIT